MNGEILSIEELHRQLYLAQEEYTSFRNQMMMTPAVTVAQIESAILRADRVAALVRMIRGKVALIPSTSVG